MLFNLKEKNRKYRFNFNKILFLYCIKNRDKIKYEIFCLVIRNSFWGRYFFLLNLIRFYSMMKSESIQRSGFQKHFASQKSFRLKFQKKGKQTMISEDWSVAAMHRFISAWMRRRWRRRIYRIIDCKLVNVSPLLYHLNSPSPAKCSAFTFFQSARHTIADAASFPPLFAREFARSLAGTARNLYLPLHPDLLCY